MHRIPVISHQASATFESIEDVFRALQSDPLRTRADQDAESIRGATLIGGAYHGDSALLDFSNGLSMHITIREGKTDWTLTPRAPRPGDPRPTPETTEPIALAFPWGETQMQPTARITDRIGARLRSLQANQRSGLFVYFHGCVDLLFHPLYRRDTGENMLYVIEDE